MPHTVRPADDRGRREATGIGPGRLIGLPSRPPIPRGPAAGLSGTCYFFSDLAPYRFSHSARIPARLVAAHWKSFLAMCSSMFAGRNSIGLASLLMATTAYPSL